MHAERIAWCKSRALELLDSGDLAGAIASMLSDVQKFDETRLEPIVLRLLAADGMMFRARQGKAAVRDWIEGFN